MSCCEKYLSALQERLERAGDCWVCAKRKENRCENRALKSRIELMCYVLFKSRDGFVKALGCDLITFDWRTYGHLPMREEGERKKEINKDIVGQTCVLPATCQLAASTKRGFVGAVVFV